MRSIVAAIGFCLINVATGPAYGPAPIRQLRQRVACRCGEHRFVSEGGVPPSHRRRTVKTDNTNGPPAWKAIANIDPDSKRIYMWFSAAQMAGIAPSQREDVAISTIVALGQDGVDAVTSEDKTIRARTYIAPFSYIEVWVLDPKSLAMLDKQQGFDSQKLADPRYKSLDLSQSVGQKYVAGRISSLIGLSVGSAVMHSELNRRGTVEVGELKVVNPDDAKK